MTLGLKSPLVVQVELTQNCNHSCYYCYNFFSHEKGNMLSVGQIKRVSDELLSNEVFSVVFTGGEPLMNRAGFNSAIEYLRHKKIDIYVNTNLSLPLSSREIKNLKDTKLVLVSFPSYNSEKFRETTGVDDQERVLANLENLISEGIRVGINQVVTKRNQEDVYPTGIFLSERLGKLEIFSATPIVAVRRNDFGYELTRDEILKIGANLIKIEQETGIKTDMLTCVPPCLFPAEMSEHIMAGHGCSAGLDMAVISANGDLRRCTKLEKSYGNILVEELDIIWKRASSQEKTANPLCDSCSSTQGCYGGCELRADLRGGADPLIAGPEHYSSPKSKFLVSGRHYSFPEIKTRKEGEGKILISDGCASVFGNQKLLDLIEQLKGEKFTKEEIEKKFGQKGLNLFAYLYNRGLLKNGV